MTLADGVRDSHLRAGQQRGPHHRQPAALPQRPKPALAGGAGPALPLGGGGQGRTRHRAVRRRRALLRRPRLGHAGRTGGSAAAPIAGRRARTLRPLPRAVRGQDHALAQCSEAHHRRRAGLLHFRRVDRGQRHGHRLCRRQRHVPGLELPVFLRAVGHASAPSQGTPLRKPFHRRPRSGAAGLGEPRLPAGASARRSDPLCERIARNDPFQLA